MSIYAVDWDNQRAFGASRPDRPVDSGTVLDTRTLSSFHNGDYLTWNVTGHVQLPVHQAVGKQRRAQRPLLRRTGPRLIRRRFCPSDTTTQGTWKGTYGTDGYNIIGDLSSYPSLRHRESPRARRHYTWSSSTTDTRALQKADTGATDRIAACWYSGSSRFTVDVNLTDGQTASS